MRVLFDGLALRHGGGAAILLRLVEGFRAAGHEVVVLGASPERAAELKAAGADVVLRADLGSARAAMLFRLRGFEAERRRIAPDLVFSFNAWTPAEGRQATLHVNVIPYLPFAERRRSVGLARAALWTRGAKRALRRSDLNMFESAHLMDLAAATGTPIRNGRVAYTGIDLPPPLDPPPAVEPRMVTVTSAAPYKRNDLTVALHRELASEAGALGLLIGGSGRGEALRAALPEPERAWIDERDDVRFLGYRTREELYADLAGSLCLVCFSELESFYMVPVEAMRVGTPVVIARHSSAAESVGDAALMVEPGDVSGAAEAVRSLMDPMVRAAWSERALAWARRFDADRCMAAIVAEVEAMLHG